MHVHLKWGWGMSKDVNDEKKCSIKLIVANPLFIEFMEQLSCQWTLTNQFGIWRDYREKRGFVEKKHLSKIKIRRWGMRGFAFSRSFFNRLIQSLDHYQKLLNWSKIVGFNFKCFSFIWTAYSLLPVWFQDGGSAKVCTWVLQYVSHRQMKLLHPAFLSVPAPLVLLDPKWNTAFRPLYAEFFQWHVAKAPCTNALIKALVPSNSFWWDAMLVWALVLW